MGPPYAIGSILRIGRYRGEAEGVTGEVVNLRDLIANPVAPETERDRYMPRSRWLVTLRVTDGLPEGERPYRAYYDGFIEGLEVVNGIARPGR